MICLFLVFLICDGILLPRSDTELMKTFLGIILLDAGVPVLVGNLYAWAKYLRYINK